MAIKNIKKSKSREYEVLVHCDVPDGKGGETGFDIGDPLRDGDIDEAYIAELLKMKAIAAVEEI